MRNCCFPLYGCPTDILVTILSCFGFSVNPGKQKTETPQIPCFRKVAVHLGYGTVRVQACIDAHGHHFQHLLQVHSDFPNAQYNLTSGPKLSIRKKMRILRFLQGRGWGLRSSRLDAVSKCNLLPTFQDNVAVSTSRVETSQNSVVITQ
jgi:hypothetical protein